MTVETPIKNLEVSIEELKKSAKDISNKKTKGKIEKVIAELEEAKEKLRNPKAYQRSFKSVYMIIIPFAVFFAFLGVYYFGFTAKVDTEN